MRFETDAPVPELVRQVPHVAFEVSDLASELIGREILVAPNSHPTACALRSSSKTAHPLSCLSLPTPTIRIGVRKYAHEIILELI